MKISYKWLNDLVSLDSPPEEIARRLTSVGLAVESVDPHEEDSILDFDLTSNRPDCLSHLGIARECAVIENKTLGDLFESAAPSPDDSPETVTVDIREHDLCPRYTARVIKGVKIGPSPKWLSDRLEAIGQRSINNVADVTNYVLHEVGQPLHAFDLSTIGGRKIVVRRAVEGEKLRTLDGVDRSLEGNMLIIADQSRPIALGGVMGGEETEISESTRDVLIESAFFNPDSVRRTSRKLGLHTEASHRFERGVDPLLQIKALDRCVSLICNIAGGSPSGHALDANPSLFQERSVSLNYGAVDRLTGLEVSDSEARSILLRLGFQIAEHSMLNTSTTIRVETFRVPSWRFDIAREEDLVEEVARHYGYDKIESLLPAAHSAGFYHPSEEAKRGIRACLSILGFDEAVNFSFIPVKLSQNVELLPAVEHQRRGAAVILRNPIIEGADLMRPSLIPGLLATVRHNLNQGNRNLQIFEMGRVFFESVRKGELPAERESLGLVVTGEAQMEGTIASDRLLDFFDLKGAIEACSDEARFEPVRFAPTDVKHLRTGQSAGLYSGSNLIGYAGRLNEEISQSLKFRHPVYVAELDLTSLLENRTGLVRYSPLPRFPLVHRDLSVIVDRKVSLSNIIETIQTNAVELLTAVDFVRVFEGGNILPGKKSVTVRLTYRADDRTLRDDEVEQIQNAVVFSLNERLGGEVRV